MTTLRVDGLLAVLQPFERVLSHRLQHAVAWLVGTQFHLHQRLFHQVAEEVEHILAPHLPCCAHGFGGL